MAMTGLQVALFGVITVGLGYVSRASLLRPRSHGFYRFLAWETILALVLLNAPGWFREWSSWHQIISWLLLFVSIIPLVLGIARLRSAGKVDYTKRPEKELLSFERTTTLVTDGIYHYIRHPLYSSLLLLAWGVFFKQPTVPASILAILVTVLLLITAKRDEAECVAAFGTAYEHYREQTRMFIPYIL